MTSHTLAWKQQELEQMKKEIKEYPVIAFTDLRGMQANLFQEVRKALYPNAKIKISKTRIVKKALTDTGIDTSKFENMLDGPIGIIFSKLDSFELYSIITKKKLSIAAKPGVKAPKDLVVPEGDTGIPPGPALSDLKAAGLQVQPKGTSIHIMRDKVVAAEGDVVTKEVANALGLLDIKPIEVNLTLTFSFEDGKIYKADVLHIDTDEVFNKFITAQRNAFNLAFNMVYVTKQNADLLLQKAFRDAKGVALEAGVANKVTVGELLGKANRAAAILKAKVPDVPAAPAVEEKKEETPKEEKKEESKPEEKKDEAKPEEKLAEEKKDA